MSRKKGGRGIKSIRTFYKSRSFSLRQHLLRHANKMESDDMQVNVKACIIRVGNELLVNNDITETDDAKPKSLSRKRKLRNMSSST